LRLKNHAVKKHIQQKITI